MQLSLIDCRYLIEDPTQALNAVTAVSFTMIEWGSVYHLQCSWKDFYGRETLSPWSVATQN